MAVSGSRNGMMGDENEGGDAPLEFYHPDHLSASDSDSDTPPHLRDLAAASVAGDFNALKIALDYMADNLVGSIDEPVEDGDTALHLTCLYGHLPCAQLLIERGASLEVKDEDGALPLHDACAGGFTEIVQLILDRACEPQYVSRLLEAVDVEGDTPLHHAARGEHAVVIQTLLNAGASPTKSNVYGKAPYELADPGTFARRVLEAVTSVS